MTMKGRDSRRALRQQVAGPVAVEHLLKRDSELAIRLCPFPAGVLFQGFELDHQRAVHVALIHFFRRQVEERCWR